MTHKIIEVDEGLPKKIFQFRLSQFKGWLTKEFLEMIVKPIQGPGIKKNNYFIVRTDAVYQFREQTVESTLFMMMLTHSLNRGCQYVMIINK